MSKPSTTNPSSPRIIPAQLVAPPESRRVVLVMLFVLMGVLAVPMLWRSPHFSQPAKVVLSIAALLQTVAVVAVLTLAIAWFIGHLSAAVANHY